MDKKNILIVDDDLKIIKIIKANLRARGYTAYTAQDGEEALIVAEEKLPDLIVLDLLMPKLDGYEVCRRLREWSDVPILMLSALNQPRDKIKCLELGADDYLGKPFAVDELIARIESLLRRASKSSSIYNSLPCIRIGNLEINLAQGHVNLGGSQIGLTATEYKLLQVMAQNRGKVLTHEYLLSSVWGNQYQGESEYLRVYFSRIRKKLACNGNSADYIKTIPGIGYQLG